MTNHAERLATAAIDGLALAISNHANDIRLYLKWSRDLTKTPKQQDDAWQKLEMSLADLNTDFLAMDTAVAAVRELVK